MILWRISFIVLTSYGLKLEVAIILLTGIPIILPGRCHHVLPNIVGKKNLLKMCLMTIANHRGKLNLIHEMILLFIFIL